MAGVRAAVLLSVVALQDGRRRGGFRFGREATLLLAGQFAPAIEGGEQLLSILEDPQLTAQFVGAGGEVLAQGADMVADLRKVVEAAHATVAAEAVNMDEVRIVHGLFDYLDDDAGGQLVEPPSPDEGKTKAPDGPALTDVKGIGEKTAKALKAAGIATVADLAALVLKDDQPTIEGLPSSLNWPDVVGAARQMLPASNDGEAGKPES